MVMMLSVFNWYPSIFTSFLVSPSPDNLISVLKKLPVSWLEMVVVPCLQGATTDLIILIGAGSRDPDSVPKRPVCSQMARVIIRLSGHPCLRLLTGPSSLLQSDLSFCNSQPLCVRIRHSFRCRWSNTDNPRWGHLAITIQLLEELRLAPPARLLAGIKLVLH